ncbi:MAG: hypothetical protein E7313_00665 [Clostridiales bacterium]|nr:hypothetical protein [Clostridiales bacterium]
MINFAQARNVGAVHTHTHTHTSISYLNNNVAKIATFMCVACQIITILMCKIFKTIKIYNNKYYELE